MDGIQKKVQDAVTGSLLTPINTGPLVANTMVNQLESWCDALPLPYRHLGGEIRMSHTNATKFWRDYRNLFGTGNGNMGNENSGLRIDHTKKVIKGYASMEGTDAIMFTPKSNLIVGRRIGEPLLPVIRWQEQDRNLKGLAELFSLLRCEILGKCFCKRPVLISCKDYCFNLFKITFKPNNIMAEKTKAQLEKELAEAQAKIAEQEEVIAATETENEELRTGKVVGTEIKGSYKATFKDQATAKNKTVTVKFKTRSQIPIH